MKPYARNVLLGALKKRMLAIKSDPDETGEA